MLKYISKISIVIISLWLTMSGCKIPQTADLRRANNLPQTFTVGSTDTLMDADLNWKSIFKDQHLRALIDSALTNNQELLITLQEIGIAQNDVRLRNAPLFPAVKARIGAGLEKVGRYTSQGAGDASTDILPGKEMPEPLQDYTAVISANWELDIWKKLRNAKKAAITRYLSTVEGKNFVRSNLVAEIASSYYELLALDNELEIVQQNIALQKNALEVVKVQKQASRVTELAVQKFQAEVLKSAGMQFDLEQQITEAENRINFLLGRYPQPIPRDKSKLMSTLPSQIKSGIPAQLLSNRPDIKRAELELLAAKLDVKAARAEFYPSLGISAGIGFQAFKPSYLFRLPESLLYSLAGDVTAPLINRNAIKAEFSTANAKQIQALFNYERTVLNAYLEVRNQLSGIDNLNKRYELKSAQVDALTKSIELSNDLFSAARADYLEVLMTQRDVLESKLELVETRKAQLTACVNIYKFLGGGWQ